MNWPDNYIDDGYGVHLLTGLRISPQILNAGLWAMDKIGKLSPSAYTNVSDAVIAINTSLSIPDIDIIANDTLEIYVEEMKFNVTCWHKDQVNNFNHLNFSNYGTILQLGISNFTVTGTIKIQNESYLIAQLFNITLENIKALLNKPQISLIEFGNSGVESTNIITDVIKSLSHSGVNHLNPQLAKDELAKVPYFVPYPEL